MYGLPFYGFGGTPQHTPPVATPPAHSISGGVDTAQVSVAGFNFGATPASDGSSLFTDPAHLDGSAFGPWTMGTLSVFYRPAQPTASRDVTVPGTVAHGVWVNGLTTHTLANVKPYKPFPLVRSAARQARARLPEHLLPGDRGHDQPRRHLRPAARHGRRQPRSLLPELDREPGHRAGRGLDRHGRRLLDLERLHAAADLPDERDSERDEHHGLRPRRRRFRPEPGRRALPRDRRRDLARAAARPRGRRSLDEDLHHRQLEPDPARLRGRGSQRERRLQLQQGRQLLVGARHRRDAPDDPDRQPTAVAGTRRDVHAQPVSARAVQLLVQRRHCELHGRDGRRSLDSERRVARHEQARHAHAHRGGRGRRRPREHGERHLRRQLRLGRLRLTGRATRRP